MTPTNPRNPKRDDGQPWQYETSTRAHVKHAAPDSSWWLCDPEDFTTEAHTAAERMAHQKLDPEREKP